MLNYLVNSQTANDAEILEEIRKQIAVQMYTGEATPTLVAEYANLNKQVGILTGNKTRYCRT